MSHFLESLEARRLFAAGAVDLSFGTGGLLPVEVTGYRTARAGNVAKLADGRLVASLYSYDGITPLNDQRPGVTLLTANGSPDPRFDGDGQLLFMPGVFAGSVGVTTAPDETILVYGASGNGTFRVVRLDTAGRTLGTFDHDPGVGRAVESGKLFIRPDGKITFIARSYVTRLNPDGTVDPTFGVNGFIEDRAPNGGQPLSYILDSTSDDQGRLLTTSYAFPSSGVRIGKIRRFDADGKVDSTFGDNGVVTLAAPFGNDVLLRSIAVDPAGRIIVAGTTGGVAGFVARFDGLGRLDTTYGSGGLARLVPPAGLTYTGFATALVRSDGSVIVSGTYYYDGYPTDTTPTLFAKFTPAGLPDTTYGTQGVALGRLPLSRESQPVGVVDVGGGRVVGVGNSVNVAGATSTPAFIRLEADGDYDPTFAGLGIVNHPFVGPLPTRATQLATLPDGRYVTAGADPTTHRIVVTRHQADGAPDKTFNGNGSAVLFLPETTPTISQLAVLPDGSVLLATGNSVWQTNTGSHADASLYKFRPDGLLDSAFGNGGEAFYDEGKFDRVTDFQVLGDGKILVVGGRGSAGGDAVWRLTAAGLPDSTFGSSGIVQAGTAAFDALDVAPDGSIYLIGETGFVSSSGSVATTTLTRLTAAGGFVKTVGVTFFAGGQNQRGVDVKTASDGSVYAYGWSDANYNFWGVSKFTAALQSVTSFGDNGRVGGELPANNKLKTDQLLIEPDGRIIVGFSSYPPGNNSDSLATLTRFEPTGALETGFGVRGVAMVNLSAGNDDMGDVIRRHDGSFQTVGTANGKTVTARLLGTVSTGDIRGTFYNDLDNDGVRDAIDPTGYNPPGTRVYLDLDNDGLLDANEPARMPVDGAFSFLGLAPGSYTLRLALPSDINLSEFIASDAQQVVTVRADTLVEPDLGVHRRTEVGGFVFDDLNASGTLEGNEPVVLNPIVYIDANNNGVLESGEPVGTTGTPGTTEGYMFWLSPGTYMIRQVLPVGWTQTSPAAGAAITHTVDLALSYSRVANFLRHLPVTPPPPTIGPVVKGTVFNDKNKNGKADTGETGLAGFTAWIDLDGDSVIDAGERTVLTDSAGVFSLPVGGLTAAANTRLRVKGLAGYTQTLPASNYGYVINVGNTATNTAKPFGFYTSAVTPPPPPPPTAGGASIAGVVYLDKNKNAKRDTGDTGLEEYVVFLDLDGDKVIDTGEAQTVTLADGSYMLAGLATAGSTANTRVRIVLPSGVSQTAPTNGYGYAVTLTGSTKNVGKDFGVFTSNVTPPLPPTNTGTIRGVLFGDSNKNGVFDAGEALAANRQVWLDLDDDGVLDGNEKSVFSDAAGNYSFTGLSPRTYHVRRVFPSGYVESGPARYVTVPAAGGTFSNVNIGSKTK